MKAPYLRKITGYTGRRAAWLCVRLRGNLIEIMHNACVYAWNILNSRAAFTRNYFSRARLTFRCAFLSPLLFIPSYSFSWSWNALRAERAICMGFQSKLNWGYSIRFLRKLIFPEHESMFSNGYFFIRLWYQSTFF